MRIWRRSKTRRKFKLTRSGRGFVLITVGVGIAAVNTANNLLYLVLGFLLSLLLVSGVLSDLALWGLRVHRRVAQRIFEGTEALVEIVAENRKTRLASTALEISEVMLGDPKPARFVRIAANSTDTVTYRMRAPKRGLLRLTRLNITTRYPFGLIEKGYTIYKPDEVLVYPKLLSKADCPPLDSIVGDSTPQRRVGDGNEPSGSVREYRPGDAARDIHWRRTAARGELLVREKEQESRAQVTLFIDNRFDPATMQPRWPHDFERRISEVATVAAIYLGRGVAVQVKTHGSQSELIAGGTTPDPVWRFLALLQPVATNSQQRIDEAA